MHKKAVDKLNTLSHPFAWYGDDIWSVGENHVNLQLESSCIKLCQSTTKLTASANSSRVWVLTSSKGLPRRTWVESTMLGCMATADLLWKGLERDIFLACTGEKMVKTEESGNIAMEIHGNPMGNTAFNRVSHYIPWPFGTKTLERPSHGTDSCNEWVDKEWLPPRVCK